MSKILKVLSGLILLMISPISLLVVIGVVYVIFKAINGVTPMEGINSFIAHVYSLKPLFPYLISIPAVSIILVIILKNLSKVKKGFNRN
jgi:hypothetical protein